MPARPPLLRALLHVVLAWGLGVCAGLLGTPALVASLFGGPVALLLTCGVPTAVVAALAVVLDRAAGPGAAGRSGAVVRGTAVGVLGTATVLVLAWAAIRADVDSVLPVGLRYAAAGLPFAAVAGLEWPGAVRVLTALAVVGSVAVVAVPRAAEAQRQAQADAVGTEVGTTARPWVTEVDGFRGRSPQHTGTDLLWTPYLPADGASAPVLWPSRRPADDRVHPRRRGPLAADDRPMAGAADPAGRRLGGRDRAARHPPGAARPGARRRPPDDRGRVRDLAGRGAAVARTVAGAPSSSGTSDGRSLVRRDLDTARQQSDDLQAALGSNRRIGMAIGFLVVTRQLTDDAAFDHLRRVSNQRNVKLRLVAEEVIYRGALD